MQKGTQRMNTHKDLNKERIIASEYAPCNATREEKELFVFATLCQLTDDKIIEILAQSGIRR